MPSSSKGDIEPPHEITTEAAKGFAAGAFKYGSVSLLAHLILNLPHPFSFAQPTPPVSESQRPRIPLGNRIRSGLFYRPLEGISEWLSPASRVYRGLTPQFKVFIQVAAMTLGGCIYAEHRTMEYIDHVRKVKRAERVRAEGGRY